MKSICNVFLSLLLFAIAIPSKAQWTQTNAPFNLGGADPVDGFVVNGSSVFATIGGDVYLSADGMNWTITNSSGLRRNFTNVLAYSGGNLIGGTMQGVYLSQDNGNSWTLPSNTLTSAWITGLTCYDSAVYANTYSAGVYLSTDGGLTWSAANLKYFPFYVSGVRMIAGDLSGGIYVSTNSGKDWTQTSSNFLSVLSYAYSGGNIFAGTFGSGVYISADLGVSWKQVNDGLPTSSQLNITGLGVYGGRLLAGTWFNGIWERPVSEMLPPPVITADHSSLSFGPTAIDSIQMTTIKITDQSTTPLIIDSVYTYTKWFTTAPVKDTVSNGDTLTLRISFIPDVFGTSSDSLYIVNNSKAPLLKIPLSGSSPYPLAVINRGMVSFPTSVVSATHHDSLRVTDGSINQLTIDSVYTKSKWFSAELDKRVCGQNDSLYVEVSFTPDSVRSYADTLFISNNSQTPLIRVPLSGDVPPPLLNVPTSGITLEQVALSDSSAKEIEIHNYIVNSLNLTGLSTKTSAFRADAKLPFTVAGNDSVKIQVLFVPTSFGLHLDTLSVISDGGTAKIPLSGISPYPEVVLSSATIDFQSPPIGKSYTQYLKITNSSINALIIDSISTLTKYYEVSDLSAPDTVGKSDTSTVAVTFMPDSVRSYLDTLYIYTNASVSPHKVAISGSGSTPEGITREGSGIPTVYALYQNYPNPFNPSTTIRFDLPEQSQVTVRIYDVLGREVSELVNGKLPAGYYHFTWDAGGFASGVYFYRIMARSLGTDGKDFVEGRKLLLMK